MKYKLSWITLFIFDIIIIMFSFVYIAWIKHGTRFIIRDYSRSLLAFSSIWLFVSLWGDKYSLRNTKNGQSLIVNIIKNDLICTAIVLCLVVLLQKFYYSRLLVFGTILLSTILEIIIFIGFYYAMQFNRDNKSFASSSLITKSKILEESDSDRFIRSAIKTIPVLETEFYVPNFKGKISEPIITNLWMKYLRENPELFDFLNDNLELICFDRKKTLIINSATFFNIESIDENSQQLFINLHKLNDFRRINQYIIKVNHNLVDGGVFVCCGETKSQRRHRFYRIFTPWLGIFLYGFDFIFSRVIPKLPLLQGWYFAITKGKNRALSETEMMGRFHFCGFHLINKTEIKGHMYFILKKVKAPSMDENPSYGLFIKLHRRGENGKTIYINKFRTMHPYSEYLQEYVHQTNDLQEGGKFKDDFRVTTWGRVFRKLWIDELPQLINLFKGEVSLVGVRALSNHYFNLYPKDLQELRSKFKPGLVPPFYADLPVTFDEIVASERKYLEAKSKHPWRTDWIYFWKAVWNILVKKARSN